MPCLHLDWDMRLVATTYMMYSWQLPWANFTNYRGWNEMYFLSFMANISFQIFVNCISFLPMNSSLFHSAWNWFHSIFHSLMVIISFPHGDVFIHYFIPSWPPIHSSFPGNYFIEYFNGSWWSFHSLMATYSFIISSPHGDLFIHISSSLVIISLNISLCHGDHFIPSWWPIHSSFHSPW